MPFRNPEITRQVRILSWLYDNVDNQSMGTHELSASYNTTITLAEPDGSWFFIPIADGADGTATIPDDIQSVYSVNADGRLYYDIWWACDIRCAAVNPATFESALYINVDAVENQVKFGTRYRAGAANDRGSSVGMATIGINPDGVTDYSWSIKVRHNNVGGAVLYTVEPNNSVVLVRPRFTSNAISYNYGGTP